MKNKIGHWLKVLAVIPLLGMVGVLLLLAAGVLRGDGSRDLLLAGPAMAALGMIWLGWRYPTTGGWVSLALGGLAFLRYGVLAGQPFNVAVSLMALPPVLSGVLFLAASKFLPQSNLAAGIPPEKGP